MPALTLGAEYQRLQRSTRTLIVWDQIGWQRAQLTAILDPPGDDSIWRLACLH